jgi:crotonobetainyl-CoA:carnitine CoA-transferase CaiB-like acyl-CoA transferase
MQAFSGIRVLDITRVLAGPYASYQLSLLGAEVIKIEPVNKGESTRWRSEGDAKLGDIGMSPSFLTQGANKQSLTLNLDSKEGQAIFLKLAATADVIVENLRTGSMAKRNIGYEQVCKVKPDIIYCSMTGYGQTGPKARYPAYDSVIQAAAGFMSITGTPESGPLKSGPPVVDYAMGMSGAYAISAALFQRSRTGTGQHIDISMLDSCMALMSSILTAYVNTGNPPGLRGNEAPSRSPASTTFKTADGLLAIAINEQHQFVNLLKAIGLADMLLDERFKDAASRRSHTQILRDAIQEALLQDSASNWEPIINEAGVPAAKVLSVPEVMQSEQVLDREFFGKFSQAQCDLDRDIRLPKAAFQFKTDGPALRTPPPRIGADTKLILSELGYLPEAIEAFEKSGIV